MIRTSMSMLSLATFTLLVLTSSSTAQADWSEDFNGSTLSNGWFFGSATGGGPPSPTFAPNDQLNNYPDAIVNNQLQMADPNAVGVGGAANAFGVVLENFTDLRYTGILNPNGNAASSDTVALIARGNIASGEFYAAELSFEDGKFIIFRNDDLAGNAMDLDEVTIPGLTNADSVYVDFRLVGNSISADAYDAPGGNLLGSVSATDSSYSAGVSGVLTFFAGDLNKPLLGEYDNLASMAIPEPTSVALAIAALGLGLIGRRRSSY